MSTAPQTTVSSFELRRQLVSLVLNDLLGPAGGPEEEIAESSVRERYLVGMLAPRKQALEPEEFDELRQAGEDGEDGASEPGSLPARTLFPSSFGMSFCVSLDVKAFVAMAHWGHYQRRESDNSGRLVWKRTPRGGRSQPIPLVEGRVAAWTPDEECPLVRVTGLVRRREDHFSVTLFLVNGQEEPSRRRDESWLFQPELAVEDPDGAAIFTRRPSRRRASRDDVESLEQQTNEMLYRRRLEFAVGHGVSVDWDLPEGVTDRALRIRTSVAPEFEVARVTSPLATDEPALAQLTADMKTLAEAPVEELPRLLDALPAAYQTWLERHERRLETEPDLAAYRDAARQVLERGRRTLERIREGIRVLAENRNAAQAFRFANGAMWRQRIRTTWLEQRRSRPDATLEEADRPENRTWYPFQLAFILINLPGLTRLDHPDRISGAEATCDLLWYPTGGGKTEAYLGLAAYTMALRRLDGTVAGRRGDQGLAVLMRYTLRLLTLQQFQRSAALLCACEVMRREAAERGDKRWGAEPFRLGLWVGQRTTPNRTEDAAEVVARGLGNRDTGGAQGVGTPHQLTYCPWCGARIDPRQDHIKVLKYPAEARTLIYCGDANGECPFSPRRAPGEGLPVVVVDDEIYRRLPAMLIATVDKFAQMPWKGPVQALFGHVTGWCERHGFRSPDLEDADRHPARTPLPSARTLPTPPLRPPDLIVQDELHLISGPLGSLVGLYETAIDRLCRWKVNGHTVRPKVIASTATIRRAGDQVSAVFLRRVNVFPTPGLDAGDSFFAREREITEELPGRLYLGICAPGRRLKAALIRAYVALLAASQTLYQRYGAQADPWMTLVGYFNSLRELGGMRRLADDDVRSRLRKMDERGLARRELYSYTFIEELTSRKQATEIPEILDRMAIPFDPEQEARRKERRGKNGELLRRPLDIMLATNMISVGVDVPRLGLMVVAGQPTTTSEYIQATSRVGRRKPGLIVTVYNWARPRDLSHYETFVHYHSTFYKHVEALSVTPFAPGTVARGLTGVFVSCVRLAGGDFNPNVSAGRVARDHPYVREAIREISRRAGLVGAGRATEEEVAGLLERRVDLWLRQASNVAGGRRLGYQAARDGVTVPLLRKPGLDPWTDFTCLNSLRDVEPSINLVFSDFGLDEPPGPREPEGRE
jgi:hypothetical protein